MKRDKTSITKSIYDSLLVIRLKTDKHQRRVSPIKEFSLVLSTRDLVT